MTPSPTERPGIRMDARLDQRTRQKVDDLAKHFRRPRAMVLCHIMHWGLSNGRTVPRDQGESHRPVRHLSLSVPSHLHEQLEKMAAAGVKIAPWLRHMVRHIAITDFPPSWQEAIPREHSHDSHTYTARFMLRLNEPLRTKLNELSMCFNKPAAEIVRQLIIQATPDHFPPRWQMRATEHRVHQA